MSAYFNLIAKRRERDRARLRDKLDARRASTPLYPAGPSHTPPDAQRHQSSASVFPSAHPQPGEFTAAPGCSPFNRQPSTSNP